MSSASATTFHRLSLLALCLTFVVVVLGAYVRLSDAGLGCPDWPGCYGTLTVPENTTAAQTAYPDRPLDTGKAWREVIHRYAAGTLGLLILALAVLAWWRVPAQRGLTTVLVGLVIFQALLGMWTVTLLLKPLIVSAHLLGGMTILALLLLCALRSGDHLRGWHLREPGRMRVLAAAVLAVLAAQIFLGAWTSTNYAALACPDFPTCQGQWWPQTDYARAYTLWHGLGINYEYGILDSVPRATIHWTHRLGALVTTLVMLGFAALLFAAGRADRRWRRLALLLVAVLAVQVSLGIATVVGHLPLAVADAHNGGAALLLLTVMAINFTVWRAARR